MKKNAKRLLGLLIALAMMVSLVGTMALADSSTDSGEEPVVTYIGTSVSSGFFLDQKREDWVYANPEAPDEYDTSDWDAIVADGINDFGKTKEDEDFFLAYHPYEALAPNSAPRLVAEGLKMDIENNCNPNFHKICLTGLRTSELLRFMYGKGSDWDQKMEDDWLSQAYMNGWYSGFDKEKNEAGYFYDHVREWITESDIVIVEIGANDVMATVIENLFNDNNGYLATYKSKLRTEETYQAMLELAEKTGDLSAVVTKALAMAKKAGELPLMMTAMTKALLEGTMMFYTNYGKVIKYIYDKNPDVMVLAVGTFNPLKGVNVSNKLPLLKASTLMDPNIRMMNAYIKTLAPYALSSKYDYRYVDDYDISLQGFDESLIDLLTSPNLMDFDARKTGSIHPDEEGHQYLANQILKAIKK